MSKSEVILGGRARIYQPTAGDKNWRITYYDHQHKRHTSHGGKTRDEAIIAAANLLGDVVNDDNAHIPTINECVDAYIQQNSYRWNPRTVQQYRALAKRYTYKIGDTPCTKVSPQLLRQITKVGTLSQNQRLRLRAVIRGTFEQAQAWISISEESFAQAILIGGTSGDNARNPEVQRGDIPPSKLVAAFINTAYSTYQITPIDPPGTTINPITGEKTLGTIAYREPTPGITEPMDSIYLQGLPTDIVNKYAARKIPMHYRNREQRLTDEVKRIAGMYRRTALITALGAGGGLRIGEVLALRVRHILNKQQAYDLILGASNQELGYRGYMDICEQASTATGGTIYITHPKGNREREIHLPAFLPCWNGFDYKTSQREQMTEWIPRLADNHESMWTLTDNEVFTTWQHGFIPLGWMLINRLREMVTEIPGYTGMNNRERTRTYLNMLLFPTSTPARKQIPGHVIQHEKAWHYDITIVPGTGGYQVETAYANKYANPLYDYVSEQYECWPAHRANATRRRGWTHHGLRHYACSSRIIAGVPIPIVSKELGHKDSAFTLQRYGHFMPDAIPSEGFEY